MDKAKKVLIAIGFLIPAILVAGVLVIILAKVDYGPDPGTEVGTTLWGTWALICGFYFKSNKFKLAGGVLLIFAIIGLVVGAT